MKKILFLFFLILLYLSIKVADNSIRLSDTNIYFNIAYQISHGKILYKDIFFSNLPFFSYISSIYYFLSGNNINIFYFTAAIEVSITTFFIYLIAYKKTKDYLISIISSVLYIFSFIVLNTSNHQTGVFAASLFAVLGYYFLQEKKPILSGIFVAASLLTKAYFLPIFISFFVYLAIKKEWNNLIKFGLSSAFTGLLILLPSLILAPSQMFADIFGFSLTRPTGLSKINIMWFFITRDIPLFILLVFNIFNIKKNVFFGLISVFSIIFFFGYQDIYYLYLNFMIPFLCLSFYEMYLFLNLKFKIQKFVIPTIVLVFILFNLTSYLLFYRNLDKLDDFNKIETTIIKEKPNYLYGINDITPALIALTNIPALENVNDAHEYFFTRKIYDKKLLTEKAINSKTIIITHGAFYPEFNIRQDILDNIFVNEEVLNKCRIILSAPITQTEGAANRINLFKCY